MIEAPTFKDAAPYTTLTKLFAEGIGGWMHHEEGLEHFNYLVKNKAAYRYLLHAHTGSLVLLYNPAGSEVWDDAPVVLLYEGQPTAVAKNLREWLGTVHWPEVDSLIATAVMMHGAAPTVYAAPPEGVKAAKLESAKENALASDPKLGAALEALTAAGFPPATNVVAAIWAAKQAHPNLAL